MPVSDFSGFTRHRNWFKYIIVTKGRHLAIIFGVARIRLTHLLRRSIAKFVSPSSLCLWTHDRVD